jgi:hypothetical protein
MGGGLIHEGRLHARLPDAKAWTPAPLDVAGSAGFPGTRLEALHPGLLCPVPGSVVRIVGVPFRSQPGWYSSSSGERRCPVRRTDIPYPVYVLVGTVRGNCLPKSQRLLATGPSLDLAISRSTFRGGPDVSSFYQILLSLADQNSDSRRDIYLFQGLTDMGTRGPGCRSSS